MVRLIQRQLIIPRGDTGTLSIPALEWVPNTGCVGVLSIFNEYKILYSQEQPVSNKTILFSFTHEITKDLPLGNYNWDVKIYVNPQYKGGKLINGDEVHSYYAAFKLPQCKIVPYNLNKRG